MVYDVYCFGLDDEVCCGAAGERRETGNLEGPALDTKVMMEIREDGDVVFVSTSVSSRRVIQGGWPDRYGIWGEWKGRWWSGRAGGDRDVGRL